MTNSNQSSGRGSAQTDTVGEEPRTIGEQTPRVVSVPGRSAQEILDSERKDITPAVDNVTRQLDVIQKKCGRSIRFHLLVEQDMDGVIDTWIRQGSSGVNACSRVETRVLHSPTISLENESGRKKSVTLVRALNSASFQAMRLSSLPTTNMPSQSRRTGSDGGNGEGSNRHGSGSEAGNETTFLDSIGGFRGWGGIIIPDWYPFKGKKLPPIAPGAEPETHFLKVRSDVVEKFMNISGTKLTDVYTTFFRFLHKIIRVLPNFKTQSFTYTLFTPPWMRSKVEVGDTVYRIGEEGVCKLKGQRSVWGTNRIALILAAYYQYEREFARDLLMHVIKQHNASLEPPAAVAPRRHTPLRRGREDSDDPGQSDNGRSSTRRRKEIGTGRPPLPDSQNVGGISSSEINASPRVPTPPMLSPVRSGSESQERGSDSRVDPSAPPAPGALSGRESAAVGNAEDECGDVRTSLQTEADVTVTILCAAASQCRFKDDTDAQDAQFITGKCDACKRQIHDLCGGGEGRKVCPSCVAKTGSTSK